MSGNAWKTSGNESNKWKLVETREKLTQEKKSRGREKFKKERKEEEKTWNKLIQGQTSET